MVQPAEHVDLALEAVQRLVVALQRRSIHLFDGDELPGGRVDGLVNRAGGAGADLVVRLAVVLGGHPAVVVRPEHGPVGAAAVHSLVYRSLVLLGLLAQHQWDLSGSAQAVKRVRPQADQRPRFDGAASSRSGRRGGRSGGRST